LGRGKASSIAGVFLGVSNVLVWTVLFNLAYRSFVERQREVASLHDVKLVVNGMRIYLVDHDNSLPTAFSEITRNVNANDLALMPADKPHDASGLNDYLSATYVLAWPRRTHIDRIPQGAIVVYEPPTEHNHHQMTAALVDGEVRLFRENQAKAVMSELQSGHNPPRNAVIDGAK
jgi:hypothetical protein